MKRFAAIFLSLLLTMGCLPLGYAEDAELAEYPIDRWEETILPEADAEELLIPEEVSLIPEEEEIPLAEEDPETEELPEEEDFDVPEEPEEISPEAVNTVPSEAQAYAAITAMKSKFPEGAAYNNSRYYAWNGGLYSGGYGCAGFAFQMSDAAFGSLPAREVYPVTIGKIHVGDILRLDGNTHSVIVLEVRTDGVVIAEGNYSGKVHWGRFLSLSAVQSADYLLTRYPVGTFQLDTPVINYIANTVSGVQLKWDAVPGAAKYRVFRKFGSENWQIIGDTTALSFTATELESGKTYTFTVRCVSADGKKYTSGYNAAGKTITWLSAPVLKATEAVFNGIKLQWNPVPGAVKYRAFYKTSGGSWKQAVDTAAINATVTGLTSGTTYTFTVRCISADGKSYTSAYDTAGKTALWLTAPVLGNPENTENGIKVKWSAVAGAAKYRVFYKLPGGNWTKALDTTGTSAIITGLTTGKTYTFTVRAFSADGKVYTSGYDGTGKTLTYQPVTTLPTPVLTGASPAANGVTVSWKPVAGALRYAVFSKPSGGSWKREAYTTATNYTVTGLSSGTSYTFTVRCADSGGKYISGYDSVGKSLLYLSQPVLTSAVAAGSGVTVKWNAVPGAAKYRVFYKLPGGNWTKFTDTTATTCTVIGLTAGSTYIFTVRCISADGKSYTSTYDGTGKTAVFPYPQLSTPVLVSAENTTDGIRIAWKQVPGASLYRVFYKTAGTGWTKITDTAALSCTVPGLTAGTAYTFTVRCISPDGRSYVSGYDSTGKTVVVAAKSFDTPVLYTPVSSPEGITVRWKASEGAEKYRVFQKTGSAWEKVADTAETQYTVTGLTNGESYTFTVRCINAAGNAYTSSYDAAGKTAIWYSCAAPEIKSARITSNGISLSWDAVPGASSYRIIAELVDGDMVLEKVTASTSTLFQYLDSGATYRITLCALDISKNPCSPVSQPVTVIMP